MFDKRGGVPYAARRAGSFTLTAAGSRVRLKTRWDRGDGKINPPDTPSYTREKPCGFASVTLDAQAEAPSRRSRRGSPPTRSSSRRRSTPEQKQYEARLEEISEKEAAQAQGLSRRASSAPAAAWRPRPLALNQVFGDCYEVSAEEVKDPKAFEEKWPKKQFIFDVPDAPRGCQPEVVRQHRRGQGDPQLLPPAPRRQVRGEPGAANRAHYVKEVFGDSDTVMAIICGVPAGVGQEPAAARPDGRDAEVRQRHLAGSQRVLSHGLFLAWARFVSHRNAGRDCDGFGALWPLKLVLD